MNTSHAKRMAAALVLRQIRWILYLNFGVKKQHLPGDPRRITLIRSHSMCHE